MRAQASAPSIVEGGRLVASVGRLHIVAIATLGLLTFGWAFTGVRPWVLAGICGLDWFLVNLLNRVVDLPEDRANDIHGTAFVARHRGALLAVGFSLLATSLVAVHLIIPTVTPLRVAFHALGLAYNWPLCRGGVRLKQLYFWKNAASATGFMLTVFSYPLMAATGMRGLARDVTVATVCVVGVFFFLFELSYEIIYDLRDAPGDARADVRSYAVVHGTRTAARIADGLILASAGALVGGYATGFVPWRLGVMVVAPALQFVVFHRALARGITASDCIRLTWLGATLLAAYHAWALFGLPGTSS